MLDRYRRDGAFPGKNGDECEAYAMSAWVHDLKEQVRALDDKLEGPQDAKSASTWGSWLGYGSKKPVVDESMEGLYQEWYKKGKSKGALHETFFDTEYLVGEIALMRQVRTTGCGPSRENCRLYVRCSWDDEFTLRDAI